MHEELFRDRQRVRHCLQHRIREKEIVPEDDFLSPESCLFHPGGGWPLLHPWFLPQLLLHALLGLPVQAFLYRRFTRFGGNAFARHMQGLADHQLESVYGLFLVAMLAALVLGLDDNHTVLADAVVILAQQALLDVPWQG